MRWYYKLPLRLRSLFRKPPRLVRADDGTVLRRIEDDPTARYALYTATVVVRVGGVRVGRLQHLQGRSSQLGAHDGAPSEIHH